MRLKFKFTATNGRMRTVQAYFAVVVIALMTAAVPTHGLFGQDAPKTIGGQLTPDVAWHIENSVLYISGKGVVPTTMFGARSAWNDYRSLFHSVVIADGITNVGKNVFIGYKNITSLTIGGDVKDIATNAFNTCKLLSVVEVKSATPPDISLSTFYKVNFKKAKLIVPAGTKATYEADPFWSQFAVIEESTQPAKVQSEPVKTLTQPCSIHLTRTANFVGGGVKVRVFLNGAEQEALGNNQTISMQTDRDKNELYIQQGKKRAVAIRRFDATAGGDVRIEFSYFNGYMAIMGQENDE